jgi:hypothetical protein
VTVFNDGPPGVFRGEVVSIAGTHFHTSGAELMDWPWPMQWLASPSAQTIKIGTARKAALRLVLFDDSGARSQLRHAGGSAFSFAGPGVLHGIHGRLGISTMEELQAAELMVVFRVYRAGPPEVFREQCIRFGYRRPHRPCDQSSSSLAISPTEHLNRAQSES